VTVLAADEVMVDADKPEIPVGIDGETAPMPHPGSASFDAAERASSASHPARRTNIR
jgi:hypothetical protein